MRWHDGSGIILLRPALVIWQSNFLDVTGLCLAQRVRLDWTCAAKALFVDVVKLNDQMVRGCKADHLDEGDTSARHLNAPGGPPHDGCSDLDRMRGGIWGTMAPLSQRMNSGSSFQKRSTGGSAGVSLRPAIDDAHSKSY
jgi:hypothetical protein